MIGPAAVAGLARINLRHGTAGWLVVAALVAVVVSDLSGVYARRGGTDLAALRTVGRSRGGSS